MRSVGVNPDKEFDLLVEHFPEIVDYEFTAKMEDELDDIAEGKMKWPEVIREFYTSFEKDLAIKTKEVEKSTETSQETNEKCPECGKKLLLKMGRFGKFYACSGFPECKGTRPIEKDAVTR